jgi:CRP-like cAMP-binding protein
MEEISRILIIEDNTDIRENIAELLTLSGYQTIEAQNGRVGAKKALEHTPNLILCDIMMPELDGYGVLHVLSKHKETINIPFIFLTAKAEKSDMRKGMTLGADDYITKPFDETDLLNAIENRLKKSNSNQQAQTNSSSFDDLFTHKLIKSYSAKQLVYKEGDTPQYIYFLKSGKVKIVKMNRDSKEVVLELCNTGDYFGYWGALEDQNQEETAEVLEDSEVWQIPMNDFRHLLTTNLEISGKFLKLLSKNLLIKESKILELAYESVRKRVANSLVAMCDVYGRDNSISMKIPRELIASMAGTSVETAIRMLTEFKNSGYIKINASEITVLEYEKLKTAPF